MDLGKFEGVCLDSICILLVFLVDVYFLDFLFLFVLDFLIYIYIYIICSKFTKFINVRRWKTT